MMKYLIIWIGICLTLAACSNNDESEPQPEEPLGPGLHLDEVFKVSNQTRNYHIYIPGIVNAAPIVFLLHGNSGSSNQILGLDDIKSPFKLWLDIAERDNVILVIPDGSIGPNNKKGWNDCRNDAPTNPKTDDALFLGNLIDFVRTGYGTGETDVFVAGISNGGLMAMRLADEMPEKLNAISVVVASRPVNSECADSTVAMPVLFMNGTSDPILPYEGGQIESNRGQVSSTAETISYWVNRNQTEATPSVSVFPDTNQDDESTVTRFTYSQGLNGSIVEHYEVTNGGHTEPSIAERYSIVYKLIVGNQNGDIEMATELWKFFDSL